MGCPSLYVWAFIAAGYTTVQSLGFLALNLSLVLMNVCVYNDTTAFFQEISHYIVNDCPNSSSNSTCYATNATATVEPGAVVVYQYLYLVLHIFWFSAGIVILSQLCRKSRSHWDYILWIGEAVMVIILDTITGIFFIVDRISMEEDVQCEEAAFWMIVLSLRGFVLFVLNIACVVLMAFVLRKHRTDTRVPDNNYMDPPTAKRTQPKNNIKGLGPTGAGARKPAAPVPTETIEGTNENNYLGEGEQDEGKVLDQFGPGEQGAPIEDVPQTFFRAQRKEEDYPTKTAPNWQDMPSDQHRYPLSNLEAEDDQNYLSQQGLDKIEDDPMPQEIQQPFSYVDGGRPGQDHRRSMEQDGQPFDRFGLHHERQDDFARNQFDDGKRFVPPSQSRHVYENPAWTSDAPYDDDQFPEDDQFPAEPAAGPAVGYAPPQRPKRNAPNRRKRAAPQPKETPTEDSIEEEEDEAPKPLKAKLTAPSGFDPRPFSYLNPSFRPTDHADVKAMKTHTADIVKTLDLEMKQLKEKDKGSGSDSDGLGVISSPPVRSYLNDSGRRQNVKRSASLRDQLMRSGKATAPQFNKLSPNRVHAQRDLNLIEESDSPRQPRPHTADSKPGRPAVDRDGQRRPQKDNAGRSHGRDRDRGVHRAPQNDRGQGRRHDMRDQTDGKDDDYDSSDYEEDEVVGQSGSAGSSRNRDPVFITVV